MGHPIILARASEHHYIARDDNDVVCLIWGRFHAAIHADDFPLLVWLVEHWTPDQPSLTTSDHSFCVYIDAQGYIQLWIVDSGLRLRPETFGLLTTLISAAARPMATWTIVGAARPNVGLTDDSYALRHIVLPPESLN